VSFNEETGLYTVAHNEDKNTTAADRYAKLGTDATNEYTYLYSSAVSGANSTDK
jgi:hypothetical protein